MPGCCQRKGVVVPGKRDEEDQVIQTSRYLYMSWDCYILCKEDVQKYCNDIEDRWLYASL